MKTLVTLLLALLTAVGHTGPRTSTSYAVALDSIDTGGLRATSAAYTNAGSAGGITGIATAASPAETAKSGFIGQLYEVTALQLAASPATVNESATRQLTGAQLLDDLTTISVPATGIAWSVASGPIAGIDANGLATAAIVYQNTSATAQGVFGGLTATLGLTVLDTIPDNFGSYAADGLNDAWQVQYFGLNNPLAAPLLDPAHDGIPNLIKYGLVITPGTSGVRSLPPAQTRPYTEGKRLALIFTRDPARNDITLVVQGAASPAGPWTTLATSTNGASFTGAGFVSETNASGNLKTVEVRDTVNLTSAPHRFMRIQVTH